MPPTSTALLPFQSWLDRNGIDLAALDDDGRAALVARMADELYLGTGEAERILTALAEEGAA